MTTTIRLEFDSMPDERARRIAGMLEGYIHGKFTAVVNLHGAAIEHDEPTSPPTLSVVEKDGESAWLPLGRDDSQILEPGYVEIGDGVTWSYASDVYAGTVHKISKSHMSIWFSHDFIRRVDKGGPYTESQVYEYRPNPDGELLMARWNSRQRRFMIRGKYAVSPGRREYRSPSV